jgi:hypothetical protein
MLQFEVAPASFSEDDGSVGLIAYAGSKVDRFDWYTGEQYTMALDMDPKACDLSAIEAGTAPFLDSHDEEGTDQVLGILLPGTAVIEDGHFKVRAKLSVDPDKAGKVADIRAGILRALSVGTDLLKVEETKASNGKMRHVQVKLWRPFHVALVVRGADMHAQTFARQEPPVEAALPQGVNAMDEIQLAAIKDEAAKTERTRIAEIDRAALATKADPAHVAKLKADGVALDVARAALLNAAADRDAAAPTVTQISLTRDAGDTAIELAQHALLAKAIPSNVEAKLHGEKKLLWDAGKAQQFRGKRAVDICRAVLSATGQDHEHLTDRQAVKRVMLSTSSSDLPDLLGDSVGKALLYGYTASVKQFEPFVKRVNTPGLHARKPVILSGASAVGEMAEGAPYPEQQVGDTAESYSAKKYGGQIVLTLEALLRDNLDALSQVPAALANGLVEKQNQIVAALFASGSGYGPTLAADSTALFNSAHANLVDTGSGGAPTIARFAALRTLLAKMEDAQGNLQPRQGKIIVVPAELGHIAEALLYGAAMPSSLSAEVRTPSMGGIQIVQFDYLASAIYWYMFADPNLSPVIEVASPDNEPEVWADSTIDFDTDARKFKGGMYFAAAAVDYRGATMNRGA